MAGVFDLRPLVTTYVNEPLNLSVEDSERNSPLLLKDKIRNNLLIRVRILNQSKCRNNPNNKSWFLVYWRNMYALLVAGLYSILYRSDCRREWFTGVQTPEQGIRRGKISLIRKNKKINTKIIQSIMIIIIH